MIKIEINNNKIRLKGNLLILNKVWEDMKVRHPNAYWIRQHMPPGWDGKIQYLSEAGYAKTGLFPLATSLIEKYNEQYSIIDNRNLLETNEIPAQIGEFIPRDYQIEAVENLIGNEIGGVSFQRGVIGAAVNAGKTIIAAMIHKCFIGAKTLILMNSKTLYDQFMDDMPKMFGDDWGYMQGTNIKWADIMIVMTPTLKNRLTEYRKQLATYNITIFDECHLVTSKTNKSVVTALYNTSIRVGLSGTAFDHKDKTKNMDVRSFFGDEVYTIKSTELIEMGYSTPIIIKINKGTTGIKIKGNYAEEYKQAISANRARSEMVCNRIEFYSRRGCVPILVIAKYHEHVENLYNIIKERFEDRYSINYIHHKIKERKGILDSFKEGKLDILVSSLIVKLGQNMPMIKVLINAASGDSQIQTLQIVGRAVRKHKSKEKVYLDDFDDNGYYLHRHSLHRIKYYKAQGFKVINLTKT